MINVSLGAEGVNQTVPYEFKILEGGKTLRKLPDYDEIRFLARDWVYRWFRGESTGVSQTDVENA